MDGDISLAFSDGAIAAGGTCTVTVAATATTSGAKVNTTGNVSSTEGGTGNTANATLTVLVQPILTKTFAPNAIAVGGVSILTFTIGNPNPSALDFVGFEDEFPAGLQVAATPNVTTIGCGAGPFFDRALAAGDVSLNFSGTIAASGTCRVSVDVTAITSGDKVNTIDFAVSSAGDSNSATRYADRQRRSHSLAVGVGLCRSPWRSPAPRSGSCASGERKSGPRRRERGGRSGRCFA